MSDSSKLDFIQQKTQLSSTSVKNCCKLLEDKCTIPFIARYRKEATGNLNEEEIETISATLELWQKILDRKKVILKAISDQGKLSDDLRLKIEKSTDLKELEDIYLPYKKSAKTKATIALENGLKPVAVAIMKGSNYDFDSLLDKHTSKQFPTSDDVLDGALHICSDWINQNEWLRNRLRNLFEHKAVIKSKMQKGKEDEAEKFKDFFDFSEPVKRIKPYRFMAIRRGKNTGVLSVSIAPETKDAISVMEHALIKHQNNTTPYLEKAIKMAYSKQLKPAIERELFNQLSEDADKQAVGIFRKNLEQILLTAPLRNKKVLAIDPGFRTGCKIVCLGENGELEHNETIYPHAPKFDSKAKNKVSYLVKAHKIDAIAIGNGTASRETEAFIKQIRFNRELEVFVVSEAGASVYSASKVARAEFPNYDVTVRGAVSIGRRLIDPLSELVKIEPKALGVGQYQHDINSTQLENGLSRSIESCVNLIGADANSASPHLLNYISGIGPKLAQSIADYRKEHGSFSSKKDLKQVPGLGDKAFEQCAGFLRISNAENPLDNSAIHPESYDIVEQIAKCTNKPIQELIGNKEALQQIDRASITSKDFGEETINFIIQELEKPNRDVRKKAKVFEFDKQLKTIDDLKVDQLVPGIVSNITGFGAFVDIGIKENGLIHLSEMADRYVSDPNEILSLHQALEARVVSIDKERKRIGLSLKGIS